MPFKSSSQMGGAFSGAFGPKMQAAAPQWAAETPDPKALPTRVDKKAVRARVQQKLAKKKLPPAGGVLGQ